STRGESPRFSRRDSPRLLLGVDAPVLQQAGTDRAHRALMRGGELLKRPASVERCQKPPVLILAPRLARLGGHRRAATLEALHALQSRRGLIQCPNDLRTLIGALGRKDFAGFGIDSVGKATNDCKCLAAIHCYLLSG